MAAIATASFSGPLPSLGLGGDTIRIDRIGLSDSLDYIALEEEYAGLASSVLNNEVCYNYVGPLVERYPTNQKDFLIVV